MHSAPVPRGRTVHWRWLSFAQVSPPRPCDGVFDLQLPRCFTRNLWQISPEGTAFLNRQTVAVSKRFANASYAIYASVAVSHALGFASSCIDNEEDDREATSNSAVRCFLIGSRGASARAPCF